MVAVGIVSGTPKQRMGRPGAARPAYIRVIARSAESPEVVDRSISSEGNLWSFDQDPVTRFPVDPEKFARDLAAGINRLLEDPEKCRRFGDAGRRRVEETFSWTAIAQRTIRLYEQLILQCSKGVRT